jgi:HSP20 family protein
MAFLTTRGSRVSPRSVGETFAFDPFRNFFTGLGGFAGVDVTRTEQGGYRVEIPVPGFKPDEIEVTLEESVLTVAGKNERRQFTRSLLLPDDIDGENIAANVEHGLLTLTLNVHPKAQPKKIAVTFNG